MPTEYRHLQASPYLSLEFVANTTNYFCKPVSELIFHFYWPFMDPLSITLL